MAIPVNERVVTAFGLMKADQERLGRRLPNLDLLIRCHGKGCTDWFYVVPSELAGSLIVWFRNTASLMRSPRLKGSIATLDLRHFPLIEGDFLNLAIGVWEFRAVFAIPALRR